MIERLADSCRRLGRPISDYRHSLIAYELAEGSADRARKLAVEVLTKYSVNASTTEGLTTSWVRTGDYPRRDRPPLSRRLLNDVRPRGSVRGFFLKRLYAS
jgi:hypothetical protein